jgi:hypothetical protein
VGEDKRVRNDTLVAKGQRGNQLTVDERQQYRPLEHRRVIQSGETANKMGLISMSEPERDCGRMRLGRLARWRPARNRMPAVSDPSQVGNVFSSGQGVYRSDHDVFPLLDVYA